MARNLASAKAAGAKFNRDIVDVLAEHISRFIDKAPLKGAKDEGDVLHLENHLEQKIAGECKNVTRLSLGTWAAEAEAERINLKAIAGVIFHKRHGKGNPLDQWVTMTVRDFIAIQTGVRPA